MIEKGHFLPVEKFDSILPISRIFIKIFQFSFGIDHTRCSKKRHLVLTLFFITKQTIFTFQNFSFLKFVYIRLKVFFVREYYVSVKMSRQNTELKCILCDENNISETLISVGPKGFNSLQSDRCHNKPLHFVS